MRHGLLLAAMTGLFLVAGCAAPAGASAFKPVDLYSDLNAQTLARYRAETALVTDAGQGGHVLVLEQTNQWPLGLLAYWHQGTVKAMRSKAGATTYVVSESHGYGPVSLVFVARNEAMFGDEGKRLSASAIGSVLFGHLAMFHDMGARDDAGVWHQHSSAHLIHHLVNVAKAHGKTSLSLLSAPNPVGLGY